MKAGESESLNRVTHRGVEHLSRKEHLRQSSHSGCHSCCPEVAHENRIDAVPASFPPQLFGKCLRIRRMVFRFRTCPSHVDRAHLADITAVAREITKLICTLSGELQRAAFWRRCSLAFRISVRSPTGRISKMAPYLREGCWDMIWWA